MNHRYRCFWCAPAPKGLEYENATGQCPKCGRPPGHAVHQLTDVHYLAASPSGPIPPGPASPLYGAMYGCGGDSRRVVACQKRRDALALHREDAFSATDDPRAVTCSACRRTPEWQAHAAVFGELEQALAEAKGAAKAVLDLGGGAGMTDEDRRNIERRCVQLGEKSPSAATGPQARRRGELRSAAGETLANIWATVGGDGPWVVRPVYAAHVALATPGCVWLMDGSAWDVLAVDGAGWTCGPRPTDAKGGAA